MQAFSGNFEGFQVRDICPLPEQTAAMSQSQA